MQIFDFECSGTRLLSVKKQRQLLSIFEGWNLNKFKQFYGWSMNQVASKNCTSDVCPCFLYLIKLPFVGMFFSISKKLANSLERLGANIWVKVFENGPSKICERQHFKFFKGCLPQSFLGSFLNTLFHLTKLCMKMSLNHFNFLWLDIIPRSNQGNSAMLPCWYPWSTWS